MHKPLEDIKVVELSTYIAAPSTAEMLSNMGAEVIKVENFSGDAQRVEDTRFLDYDRGFKPFFDVYNAGKKSICIDIKNEAGRAVLMKLIEQADVFLTNVRSASLKRLGLDAESLMAAFPRLIYATVDGYGTKGPDAAAAGFDNLCFWGRSGLAADIPLATEGSYPIPVLSGVGDSMTAGFVVAGITSALYGRERTGRGDLVNVSLYGTAIWALSNMLLRALPRTGEIFPKTPMEVNPLVTQYRCADGEWVVITARSFDKDGAKIFRILGIEDAVAEIGVVSDASRRDPQIARELLQLMRKTFAKKASREWLQAFRKEDLIIDKLAHLKEVLTDEQALANGFIVEYQGTEGRLCPMAKPPIKLASVPDETTIQPGPGVGEHTDEILRQYGYSEEEILALHSCGGVQ
jgi:crotonobetainyl-CoA:carnitine CoA-transferase CaiB-like acyl-CoA transferase